MAKNKQQQQRQEAKKIAQNMADKGKSAQQIANRIEKKTNVSSSAASNIAARASSPSPSSGGGGGGGGSKGPAIAGVKIGNKLNAREVNTLISQGLSPAQIAARAANKGINIGGGAKNILNPRSAAPPSPSGDTFPADTFPADTSTDYGDTYYENQIPYSEYSLLGDTFSAQIQNQGLENVERIRQAGATERLKYEVDNRIPEIQAESKGKLDLQAIVNAGYKNIANIERGSDMVRNITSMFSF